MKYLKMIDFVGQSAIWLLLLGGAALILISGAGLGGVAYIGIICQLFMGCWQMVSSFLFILLRAEHYRLKFIHFFSGLICMGLIILSVWADKVLDSTFSGVLLITTAFIIPWGLALFYYGITWRWVFPERSTSKFLPHISF